jgi:molybdenum cofactor guanylyltransferase
VTPLSRADHAPIPGLGAVVLCGGESSRMGMPKAWLDFAGEPLLVRVLARVASAAWPLVVVAAPEQRLPSLPVDVQLMRDPRRGLGPLQGIAVGLAALDGRARAAFVTSTDAPFLTPAFIRRLHTLHLLHTLPGEPRAIVAPRAHGHDHPLAAIYDLGVRTDADALLAEGTRRLSALLARARTLFAGPDLLLADDELRAADPTLRALRNVNTPEDYRAALAEESVRPG